MTRRLALLLLALLTRPALAVAQKLPDSSTGADPVQDLGAAPEPAAPVGPTITSVRVEGNRRVDAEAVRNALRSKAGQPFDILRAQQDLQRVWQLGFFSDLQLLVDENPQGAVLVVRVQEKPSVRIAKIRGNNELSEDDLKELLEIKPFSILDRNAVRRNAKKLQEKYVEKGFFLAEVTPKIEVLDTNEVDVFFDVNEHAKVEIKRITLVGNEKLSDGEIKEVMQTEEGGLLSFLTSSGTYREELFQPDLSAIQALYYDRGFIHVRVGQPQIALSADKRLIFITIPVTEGEQYRIGEIGFSGDVLGTPAVLRAKMVVTKGEMFNRSKLQQDIMALSEVYYDAGYAYANISPQTTVDADKRIVDLTFDVQKGEKVTIERIEISGNTKTRDKVIRREMRVYEGELFSGSGLRQSRQRVNALGFFETVDVTYKKGEAENTVVVNVTVKEKPTGTFQVGLGFSSVENFLLTAQVSQNNLFGWGQTGSLSAQISKLRSLVQVSYLDPYFLDTNWIFSFNYFRQELDYYGFTRGSNGGDLTWGYHLTEDLMLHAGYNIEYVTVDPSRSGDLGDIQLANRFRDGLTSSLRLTLNYDKRNNRLFPSEGHYQSVSVEHSPEWLGATTIFTRYQANSRYYHQLPWGFVLKAQGTLGFIDGEDIPISELYFLGGINTVRGYTLRSIAPTVQVGDENSPDSPLRNFYVGGNKQLFFNLEVEFPIFEKVGVRGVVFYDAGNVFAENEGFFQPAGEKLPLGLRHSVGFGFRWFSPIGPLRFEFGFPLTRRPQDDSYLFEFTIGNFF